MKSGNRTAAASAVKESSSLVEFIRTRRWFRSKTRNIEKAKIEDIIEMPSQSARFLVVRLEYAEGDCDYYLLTDTGANSAEPVEALEQPEFREQLLHAFHENATLRGRGGELVFSRTNAFTGDVESRKQLESSVSRAEQSNTSILFGKLLILKLFRKIEPGINPDVEIGAFLTEHGFTHTPAVLSTVEYRSQKGDVYAAGILQRFVPNNGDAWKYTLESLDGFFERAAAAGRAPALDNRHPLDRANEQVPDDVREVIGGYLESAALLGRRTAELHLALAQARGNLDFQPEPFTPEAGHELYEEMLAQADIAFETLRRKQAALSGDAAESARDLLHREHRVTERFSALRDRQINASRIRCHGDYHLGQVLYTGTDFMIIDFEGEPARPLQERRTKTLATRDVAGMLRSFQYAAYAALFERGSKAATGNTDLGAWAATWNAWVSAEFLKSYLRAAEGGVFLPAEADQRRILLDAFVLHKALYEVAYEMNNRPDWVRIPLRGILSLIVG